MNDCENELVGLIIGIMDRMGIKEISFSDAELDLIEEKCVNQSLIVEVTADGIYAALSNNGKPKTDRIQENIH